MKTSQRGIAHILADEGERLTAYFDIAGVATISVGVTDGVTAQDVYDKRTITKEESQAMFAMALAPREAVVDRLCTMRPTQNQFDAMVSLTYNIGNKGFEKSSVLRLHNAGNFEGAAKAFLMWNKATVGGVLQVVNGLTKRREREAALYLTPESATIQPTLKPTTVGLWALIMKLIQAFLTKKP